METLDTPETLRRHHGRLLGRLAAEPIALAAWQRDTASPRLSDAYLAMMDLTMSRAAALAAATGDEGAALRAEATAVTAQYVAAASAIAFEPSRLKWLIAGRRERLAAPGLPGYAQERAAETKEAAELEHLLHELLHRLC